MADEWEEEIIFHRQFFGGGGIWHEIVLDAPFLRMGKKNYQTTTFYTQNRKNVLYYIMVDYRQVLLSVIWYFVLVYKQQNTVV